MNIKSFVEFKELACGTRDNSTFGVDGCVSCDGVVAVCPGSDGENLVDRAGSGADYHSCAINTSNEGSCIVTGGENCGTVFRSSSGGHCCCVSVCTLKLVEVSAIADAAKYAQDNDHNEEFNQGEALVARTRVLAAGIQELQNETLPVSGFGHCFKELNLLIK